MVPVLTKDTTVCVATFSPWVDGKRLPNNGNVEPLIDFFVPRVKRTVLIDQPIPGSSIVLPRVEVYKKRQPTVVNLSPWMSLLYPLLKLTNTAGTRIVFKIRDFLSIVDWCFKDKTVYDIFIGLESINALAGILMRKLGHIKTVIYYVSDYSPRRYKSKWLNTIYLMLDRFCAQYADFIWDVSAAIHPARIAAGLNPERCAPVIHVPNALYPYQIIDTSVKDIRPHTLVFAGTLGEENGPDLAIAAMPFILKRFPNTKLHIIGGGEGDLNRLKNKVSALKLAVNIIFHGYIADRKRLSRTIRQFSVALAPYTSLPSSPRRYGDATKIRAYLAAGLPVITTCIPPLAKVIADKGAGIISDETPQAIAEAVMAIFSNRRLYLAMRKKGYEYIRYNTWENEFRKAFQTMERSNENL